MKFLVLIMSAMFVLSSCTNKIPGLGGVSDADKKLLLDSVFASKKTIKPGTVGVGEKCLFDLFEFSDVKKEGNTLTGKVSYAQEEVLALMFTGTSLKNIKDDASCNKFKEDFKTAMGNSKRTPEVIAVQIDTTTWKISKQVVSIDGRAPSSK